MILGMNTETFTLLHVWISLAGIGSGLIVLIGLIGGRRLEHWTTIFLVTTVATSLTGFAFPINGLTPGHVIGALSLASLALAILALYQFQLAGSWRRTYVITATIALYLNVFVAVVQAFLKVPSLKAAAPTQSEPALALTQLAVLGCFVALGVAAVRRFKEVTVRAAYAGGEC